MDQCLRSGELKSQISNNKYQTNYNDQNSKFQTGHHQSWPTLQLNKRSFYHAGTKVADVWWECFLTAIADVGPTE
jgi:hypothetical protein